LCRLFGGRDIGVSYDSGAGTISILGQSVTISTLSSALQAQWAAAIGGASSTMSPAGASRPAFGGDNIGAAVGNILDGQPTWRNAVTTALATYVNEQTLGGQVASSTVSKSKPRVRSFTPATLKGALCLPAGAPFFFEFERERRGRCLLFNRGRDGASDVNAPSQPTLNIKVYS
jgi:hypothetical protein